MPAMPLYPGHRPYKDAKSIGALVPRVERETVADREATKLGETVRRQRAAWITSRVRELRGWQAIVRSRGAEALRLLAGEGDVPGWLRESIQAAQWEIRRVSQELRIMRDRAWQAYGDAFIDEEAPAA